MAKAKKTAYQDDLPLRFGEALASILQTIQGTIATQEIAQRLVDDLVERLAKEECKRHYDLPAWSKLTLQQKRRLLKGAEKTLYVIRDFWSEKVAEAK